MWESIINRFRNNIESLEMYVESVEPAIEEHSRKLLKQHKEIASVFKYSFKQLEEDFEETEEVVSIDDSELTSTDFSDKYDVNIDHEKKSIKIQFNDPTAKDQVGAFFKSIKYEGKSLDILYESALMNLVIYLESMVADIFREQFNSYPSSIISKKQLTYDEIKDIGSLEEAEKYLIEKEIESKMYSGFKDWCEFIKKNLKLEMKYLNSLESTIIEIISRRNLFVHNRGIVNQIYLSKVDEQCKKDISVGTVLKVDREYIDAAIKVIEEFGILLLTDIWIHNPGDLLDETIAEITSIGFEFMTEEKWSLSQGIYNMILTSKVNKKIQQKDIMLCKINYWQSLKWDGKYNKIQSELEKTDFSAYSNDIQLCMCALKDDFEKFYKILERTSKQDITKQDLRTWPIFREIRKQEKFQKYIEA